MMISMKRSLFTLSSSKPEASFVPRTGISPYGFSVEFLYIPTISLSVIYSSLNIIGAFSPIFELFFCGWDNVSTGIPLC